MALFYQSLKRDTICAMNARWPEKKTMHDVIVPNGKQGMENLKAGLRHIVKAGKPAKRKK